MPFPAARVRRGAAYALVVGASIGAAAWSADRSADQAALITRDQVQALALEIAAQQRDASLAGCNRTRADRLDAIRGWRTARRARLRTSRSPDVPLDERLTAAAAAAVYAEVIRGYRSRLVDCEEAFPATTAAQQ